MRFRNYTDAAAKWITFVEGEFYPDSINSAIPVYQPVLRKFGDILREERDSTELLQRIAAVRSPNLSHMVLQARGKISTCSIGCLTTQKTAALLTSSLREWGRHILSSSSWLDTIPTGVEPKRTIESADTGTSLMRF